MPSSSSRYNINQGSNNGSNNVRRKIPVQILIVFLLLVVVGICIYCLITYIWSANHTAEFHATTTPTNEISVQEGSWQDSNLLNISDFKWVRNNVSICANGRSQDIYLQEKLLLILVNSARENYNERSAIRKSVQKMTTVIKRNTEWTVRLIFLLGGAYEPDNSGEKDALFIEESFLDEEFSVYQDIVTGSFLDIQDNLSYKTTMGLKWALTFCSDASFIVKMADDAFFNIPKFVEWRSNELLVSENGPRAPDLYCIPQKDQVPLRELTQDGYEQLKWLVTRSEWPGNTFPVYCKGLLYGMTVDLARKIYETSRNVRYFRMEDVFFTGVVMEKVKEIYGVVNQRNLEFGKESEQTIRTICEKTVMRQTVSQEIGLVVELQRGNKVEKQMLCLAKNV